jgi:ribosomal RNA-processing protein 12
VLGTKEPSEKARGAAFELVLVMGRKMSAGGVVRRNLIDGMDEDNNEEGMSAYVAPLALHRADLTDIVAANIEEYMTMLAGGLAGASPHMISATVTAISRLVFEFKGVYQCPQFSYYCSLSDYSPRCDLCENAQRNHPDTPSLPYLRKS